MAGVIGTLSWVVLGIGLVFSSTGALLEFALLGGGSFMLDAFLATFLTLAALVDKSFGSSWHLGLGFSSYVFR
jgi:hypothetical protein